MSETMLCDLEFENREYELGRIANPSGPQFIVIDGPPEYGKTYLFQTVRKMYESDERFHVGWACALVDLADPAQRNNQRAIMDVISNQISNTPTPSGAVTDLVANLAGKQKNILLLFDAVDRAGSEVKWLAQDVIPNLENSLKNKGKRLRVVFAGRYVSGRRLEWPGDTTITLEGLDTPVIQRMIQKLEPRFEPSAAETLAQEVAFLSGGHPGSIKRILQNFVERDWGVILVERRLYPPEERDRLFREHVEEPVINKILGRILDPNVREALRILGVFRRFDEHTIEALQSRRRPYISKSVDSQELLDQLVSTGLVRPPVPRDPFYSDAIVRNLILVQMQFNSLNRYLQLNRLACKIYDAWIKGQDIKGNPLNSLVVDQNQVIFMVESFYHFLQCEKKPSIGRIEKRLNDYFPKLRSAFIEPSENPQGLRRLLMDSVTGDQNIQRRLRDLFGEAKVNALLDRVFHSQEQ